MSIFILSPNRVDPGSSLKPGEIALSWPGFCPKKTTQGFVPGPWREGKVQTGSVLLQVQA
jgi:hypothetical protein